MWFFMCTPACEARGQNHNDNPESTGIAHVMRSMIWFVHSAMPFCCDASGTVFS
jgi:hypothetical protein